VERENPNGVGSLDGWLSASPLAFEPWRRNGGAKSPSCPGLDRPGDRGGAAPSFAQARTQGCVWRGVKGVFPVRAGFDSRVSALRSLGVRAAWLARPSHRAPPARCGSVDRPPGKGEGEREEGKGKTVTDMWALPGSETGEYKVKGFGCWADVAGWVAGPARLLGPQRAFGMAGSVGVQSLGKEVLD
jgi:hypothetical protein